MFWTKSFLHTLRDDPSDAEIASHKLMVRAGLIKKLTPGIFTYGNVGLRAIRKLENIIREELAKIDCQEILMPMVQPASLWQESGRWPHMGELLKFKNKNDHDYCLGATHEEVVTDYVRNEIQSYRDFPVSLYQIQTKYRDEIRPRFGLFRGREFLMKDAYTFDRSVEEAHASYEKMRSAYTNIFKRLGLDFCAVEADTGAIGGDKSHEFQVLAEAGMDNLLVCSHCAYSSNVEITPVIKNSKHAAGHEKLPLEKFDTPQLKTIADLSKKLNIPDYELVKTFFVKSQSEKQESFALLIPGDYEVNLIKVKKALGLDLEPVVLDESEVKKLTGALPGSCGPVGLKIKIIADTSLQNRINFIVGANEDNYHFRNVNFDRDFEVFKFSEIKMAKDGDCCPNCGSPLKARKGIEVGHIFYLGKKYTEAMSVKYLDESGKSVVAEMGCYGIGVTRTVQAAIEQCHDKDGIIWPVSICPYWIHICALDPKDEELMTVVNKIYADLTTKGIEVFVDDRDERPGVKFKDADLLGFPYRLNIGKKGMSQGEVEVVNRKTKSMEKIKLGDVSNYLIQLHSRS